MPGGHAEGPPPHKETAAVMLVVRYEYPARGDLPPVTLTWYDGGKRPSYFAEGKLPKWGDGTLFVGEKGMLLAGYDKRVLLPEKQFEGFVPPKPTIPDSIGHHKEWVEACKTGGPTTCNFDYSGALTEADRASRATKKARPRGLAFFVVSILLISPA